VTKDVDEMAASLVIEHETGTWYGQIHPHNGYYGGDFSRARRQSPPRPDTRHGAPVPTDGRGRVRQEGQ
jgi:hypothetical protein